MVSGWRPGSGIGPWAASNLSNYRKGYELKLQRLCIGSLRHQRSASNHSSRRFAAVLLGALVCLAPPVWAAGTFYVDVNNPNANDSGPGTEVIPYRTIHTAARIRGGPGTTILVKPGIYREQVTVEKSGSAAQAFVIRAQASPVILDGSDDFGTALWTQGPGSSWVAASLDSAPHQVFADGARLVATTAAPASMASGTYRFIDGQGLYVNVGGNPGNHAAKIGRRTHGFRLSGDSYVTVQGFQVTRTEDHGIYILDSAHHITIRNNVVTFPAAHGIAMVGGNDHLIEGNIVSDCRDHGINLLSGVTASTIQDNESFRNARVFERAASGIMVFASSNNLIQRNRLHDNEDTGSSFITGANNNTSLQNISWNNGDHGFDHIQSTGTLRIGDVAYGNANDGISVEGGSTGTRNYNCIIANNGLGTGRFDLFVDAASTAGFVSNFNVIWNSTAQNPVKFNNIQYATLVAFTSATDHDESSDQSDPRFVNPATGDFHLLSGSKAIDSAISSIPGWPLKDAVGQSRVNDPVTPNTGVGSVTFADRGALEFVREGSVAVGDLVAAQVSLGPAYPNPARSTVAFTLQMSRPGRVDWYVTDVLGRIVYEEAQNLAAGGHQIRWSGASANGKVVPAGVYLVRVDANGETLARRFAVVH